MAQHLQGWLKALADVGAAVNHGVSLNELLDLIAKTACKLMSYDFCAITIPDKASEVLLIEGSYGLSADYIREIKHEKIKTWSLLMHAPPVSLFSDRPLSKCATVFQPGAPKASFSILPPSESLWEP